MKCILFYKYRNVFHTTFHIHPKLKGGPFIMKGNIKVLCSLLIAPNPFQVFFKPINF